MKANVLSQAGTAVSQIDLPFHFSTPLRQDLIHRAVVAAQKNRRQPYGTDPRGGYRTSARYMGTRKGWGHSYSYGQSRVPRLMLSGGRRVGKAKRVSQAVGGRTAYPPRADKNWFEKINEKEKHLAIRSAVSATAVVDIVKARGHRFESQLPIILEDSVQSITKSKDVITLLQTLKVWADIERATVKETRAGRGTRRGRRYKKRKSILFVLGEDKGFGRAARNLPGVDVVTISKLNAELLAPGALPGRLTIWTAGAIEKLKGMFGK